MRKNGKLFLFMCIILCLFAINGAFATDMNDEVILNDNIVLDSSDEVISEDNVVLDSSDEVIYDDNVEIYGSINDEVDDSILSDSVENEVDDSILAEDENKIHIDINSYNSSSSNPHSINVNNNSDYVAKIYAPTGSEGGTVSVYIGKEYDVLDEINYIEGIESLEHQIDVNDPAYSNFYIRPRDLGYIPADWYYLLVVYNIDSSLEESAEEIVQFVGNARYVLVDTPPEIVIGDVDKSYLKVFVEGNSGYLRVLIDNEMVFEGSVDNLDLDEGGIYDHYLSIYLGDLSIGSHTYNVSYYDGDFDNVSFEDSMDVTYLLDILYDYEIYYGDAVDFLIVLPSDTVGSQIKVNGTFYDINLLGGKANLTLSGFELGENNLEFSFNDSNYGEKNITVYFNVNPKLIIPTLITPGNDEKIIFRLPDDAQGKLNISLYDNDFNPILKDSLNLVAGDANYSFDSWSIGFYHILVEYDDGKYYVSEDSYINISPFVDLANETVMYENGTGKITLSLAEVSSGTLTVYVNGEIVSTVQASSGTNSIPVSGLILGDNDVQVVFNDDSGYSDTIYKVVRVSKIIPTVDISTPTTNTPEFSIDLPSDATGSLIVKIGGKTYTKNLVDGKATISVPDLADGTYEATITYTGDEKYDAFNKKTNVTIKTIPKPFIYKDPKLTIKGVNIYKGQKEIIKITTDPAFSGNVSVKINSKTYVVKVVKGNGSIAISGLAVGTYLATASFDVNDMFYSSTKSAYFKVKATLIKLNLKKVKVKRSAKKLIIKATLRINGKLVKGKKLTFKFNKKVYKAKTNKKGVAKITIKKKVLKKLKVGKKLRYQVRYGKKTVKRTVKVKK